MLRTDQETDGELGSKTGLFTRVWSIPFGRIALALLTAALLACALPRPDLGWMAWVALAPLVLACEGLSPGRAAGLGFLSGFAGAFGIFHWIFQVPAFGWRHAVALGAVLACYTALFCGGLALVRRRGAPLLLAVLTLWVGVDWLRAHSGFLSFPWGTLAHTQHENLPLLQVASLVGELGVTGLVAFGNGIVAEAILCLRTSLAESGSWRKADRRSESLGVWRGIAVGVLLIALAHLWGWWVLSGTSTGPRLRVAAIQPNIQLAARQTAEGRNAALHRLEELTRAASAEHPTLIVWPESAIPGDVQADSELTARLQRLTNEIGIPLIVGAAEVEKFETEGPAATIGRRWFNTAQLFRPHQPPDPPYRKRVLMPFGEYRPHPDLIPWPEWLAPRVAELTPGAGTRLFTLDNGLSVGALICWESLFASPAQASVRDGAQLLVHLTNDVWFGRSAASRQHNLTSVLRAVENRVPVVIASNTGPSQIIDGYGRVLALSPDAFAPGIVAYEIPLNAVGAWQGTPGDLFVYGLMAWLGVVAVGGHRSGPGVRGPHHAAKRSMPMAHPESCERGGAIRL